MFKMNAWFFWVDRLHISVSERYFIAGLILLYLVLSAVEPLVRRGNPYDEAYYRPLMQAFYERMEERFQEDLDVLDRYYPDLPDTVIYLASLRLPEQYRESARHHMRIRSDTDGQKPALSNQTEEMAGAGDYNNDVGSDARPSVAGPTGVRLMDSSVIEANEDSVRININTGDIDELTKLPGIGPSIARRIIEYREENGPFQRPEDIMNVRGIGPARFEYIGGMIEI